MLVAHCSDLHLRSFRGVSPLAFLGKRALGGANLLLRRAREHSMEVAHLLVKDLNDVGPDHVVVSGDLTNLSFASEFETARELLRELSLPASEVTVVPGNHDCYTYLASLRDDFSRILAPFVKGDLVGSEGFPFVRMRGDVALVALSTARPSAPFLAVGSLGEAQLKQAETLLLHPEVRDKFRLVALHHPPRVAAKHHFKRLTDSEEFLGLLRRTGAELVVHGHLHRACHDELEGLGAPIPVIGVTSATWLPPHAPERRAAYNLYEIEGRTLRRVVTRRYDSAARRFI
ncbi:MAG: metallophosphoesterase [Deltaproteobacteria bacterium]|nr:metallophosphoesterase [Deltaproteobacteria bacterium]